MIYVTSRNFRNLKWLFYPLTFWVWLDLLTFDILLSHRNDYRITGKFFETYLNNKLDYYYISLVYKVIFLTYLTWKRKRYILSPSWLIKNDPLNNIFTTRTLNQNDVKRHSGQLFSFARDAETSRRWLKCPREF